MRGAELKLNLFGWLFEKRDQNLKQNSWILLFPSFFRGLGRAWVGFLFQFLGLSSIPSHFHVWIPSMEQNFGFWESLDCWMFLSEIKELNSAKFSFKKREFKTQKKREKSDIPQKINFGTEPRWDKKRFWVNYQICRIPRIKSIKKELIFRDILIPFPVVFGNGPNGWFSLAGPEFMGSQRVLPRLNNLKE